MNEQKAIALVKSKFGNGYQVKKIRETPTVYLFMCETADKSLMPDKLVAAVNKTTSRIGFSNKSYDEAIRGAMK